MMIDLLKVAIGVAIGYWLKGYMGQEQWENYLEETAEAYDDARLPQRDPYGNPRVGPEFDRKRPTLNQTPINRAENTISPASLIERGTGEMAVMPRFRPNQFNVLYGVQGYGGGKATS